VTALEQQETPAPPTVAPLEPSAYARTVQIHALPTPPAEEPQRDIVALDSTAPTLASPFVKAEPKVEYSDPELIKLFTEEAREELVKIQRDYPIWDQNPLEREALIGVRRSFHTLKGSGRMVGARALGEFAWSIENLLNRVLDNTLSRSPAILETLRAATAALPEFVTELENGTPVRTDVSAISSRAHALAAGRSAGAARVPEPERVVSAAPPPEAPAPAAPVMSAPVPAPEPVAPAAPAAPVSEPVAEAAPPAPPPEELQPSEFDTLLSSQELFAPEEIFVATQAPIPAAPPAPAAAAAPAPPEAAAEPVAVPEPEPAADDTLRDIYARETAARRHGACVPRARVAAARAAPLARGCLPCLPHALGQLEDGAGTPRHPPGRAARSLAAPCLQQRGGTEQR
jgi:chemosensory pili system protein ChpA (sensor histidine kinase/response regulator)